LWWCDTNYRSAPSQFTHVCRGARHAGSQLVHLSQYVEANDRAASQPDNAPDLGGYAVSDDSPGCGNASSSTARDHPVADKGLAVRLQRLPRRQRRRRGTE
jgi:hypothetical protein